jgi:mono/diheme cytochrome c family protein
MTIVRTTYRTTHPTTHRISHRPTARALLASASLLSALTAGAATPADLLAGYTAQAGAPAQAARGQAFFNSRHGKDWTCASCHGAVPTQAGKHASTGKPITALAPAFNPERFSDPAKVEKWFRRNCNDVADRACTPAEKADVMAWLISLRP